MFREAAISLPDYANGEQYWPKYALLTHAIELSLKAFADYSVVEGKPPGKEPKQHDLTGWYALAIYYGLMLNIPDSFPHGPRSRADQQSPRWCSP